MKETRMIRLDKELVEKIDHDKPSWMSRSQFLANLMAPLGDESYRRRRFADYQLDEFQVGDYVTIMVEDHKELDALKNHLTYLKRKSGLAFQFTISAKDSKLAVDVTRI